MNDEQQQALLARCFYEHTGRTPSQINPLRPHASERRMFRLADGPTSVIGVINTNREENDAFVHFARYFTKHALPVPTIYIYHPDECVYLEQDLGDQTLFDLLAAERTRLGVEFPATAEALYKRSLEHLARFQIECAADFDFTKCHPEIDLLPGTFAGDCSSFAQDLVGRLLPSFDITTLTRDFAELITFLEKAESSFFVYRDFQSRNIMCVDGKPYFIDFQSGRRGPLQYDVVSLLYQASTCIPQGARNTLVEHYCSVAANYTSIDTSAFYHFYRGFIICRMLQVLGVYGRQGLGAGKSYFANSIPAAIRTLAQELSSADIPLKLPHLRSCVTQLHEELLAKGTS
jgi:aminoglycoside/choline kinase family phosphotransferase